MVTFADVGGITFAGAYLLTSPVVLADGPQPGPVDAMWLFGLAKAYNTGRRLGARVDYAIEALETIKAKPKQNKSIEELKWTPKQQNLLKTSKLEQPALHSGSWIVRQHAKKKRATSKGLYA